MGRLVPDVASGDSLDMAAEFRGWTAPNDKRATIWRDRKGMRRVSVGSLLRSFYLLYFSQPAADRALFRAVRARPIRSIVELGISLNRRTPRLLEIAGWRTGNSPLRYTGIDQFESRPADQPSLSVKQAFA